MAMDKQEFNQMHGSLLKEKHENLITNIKELQELEKFMFQNLKKLEGQSETAIQQREILDKINNLSNIRLGLFSELKNMYNSSETVLNSTRDQLSDQIAVVGVVENELNRLKENINTLESEKDNKLRMVEIGNYESARYSAHIGVMQTLVFCSIVILVSSVLLKNNMIPQHVSSIIILITLAYGLLSTVYTLYDLFRRDNHDYYQYDFAFDKEQYNSNYETVIEHDELFFNKVFSGVRSEFNDRKEEIKNTVGGLHKLGLSADNKKSTVVDNTPKGVENFANY